MMPLGGIETHLVNMSCYLAQQGWKVDFCVKYSAITHATAARFADAGVRYHKFPRPSFFRHTLLDCSLLYTNSQGNFSPLIWRLGPAQRKGLHHCHTACSAGERESWTQSYVEFIKSGPPLVACSQATASNLQEIAPGRDIRVLPYFAIREDAVAGDPVHSGEAEELKHSRLHFGFVGRLEASKGIELLVQAAKKDELADICWHVFGDGNLADAVRAAEGPNFVWHGAVDSTKGLDAIYGRLDAVVLPSRHVEGSPLCLIEALAHGKPWVAFDQGGIRELVADPDDCIIASPSTAEAFCAAVVKLRSRIRAGKVDGRRLMALFDTRFSQQSVMAQWQECLELPS
jgi:glycosyltransferase involved in cell wall biosynthesis